MLFFISNTETDYAGASMGQRIDGRNLIKEWENGMKAKNLSHQFVWNADGLRSIDADKVDYAFGLFTTRHMAFDYARDNSKEPSLSEMTEKAIEILQKNKNGFFLLVEGKHK